MIADMVVVDAVVHPYNLSPENQDPDGTAQLEALYASHRLATGSAHGEYQLSRKEFFSDFPFEAVAGSLFVESPVDLAVIHALPNLGYCRGYVTEPGRAAVYRSKHPDRFLLYATVDTPVTDAAIGQLEWQVHEFGVDGLKLYPAFFYDGGGQGWRLDDADFATPLLEAARDLGIRNVAVHKALWVPPAPTAAFRLDDLDAPLERFADMNFQIVHAGAAFLHQTAELLGRHRNLYATLESVFAYAVVKPRVFARILGTMLTACGPDQLLYASGSNLSHPAPLLAAFDGYEFGPDALAESGVRQLTASDRRKILGENALRLHGLDAGTVRPRIADDEFSRARAAGPAPPWQRIRAGAAGAAS
ncbi:MAG: amidohydrolase family protein [Streptosporangiaceae bacterium]|jgi:predicted TIM-barrel fold metal-dependent hydrolase